MVKPQVLTVNDRPQNLYVLERLLASLDVDIFKKLFGVFQRLHLAEEYAGAGLGLARTRRIINRHGGHIWAEAEPGKGAIFYFTLPEEMGKSQTIESPATGN